MSPKFALGTKWCACCLKTSAVHHWPTVLRHGPLTLRPVARGDYRVVREVKAANATWLQPWQIAEQTGEQSARDYYRWVRHFRAAGKRGEALALVLEVEGTYAGQLLASPITYGASASATLGYWIAKHYAGRGYIPLASAMLIDYLVDELAVHRIEVNVRPENSASKRVVEKLGFTAEGTARGLLHVNGAWRDHIRYGLLAEDIPAGGMVAFVDNDDKLQ